ncbi:glycine cleavage system protein GcvH [Mycoplasmatota bacterium]|nr:glycine cleavage system protein GcvH [Mycoplasmatota bacterium]
MKVIEGLYYSKEHEWIKVVDGKAYIGITEFAAHALGDIVFVELPEVDADFNKDEVIGVIESVKAASDMFTPISGTVIEVNENLEDEPQLLNSNPFENHIAVIELKDESELEELMNSEEYTRFCEEK